LLADEVCLAVALVLLQTRSEVEPANTSLTARRKMFGPQDTILAGTMTSTNTLLGHEPLLGLAPFCALARIKMIVHLETSSSCSGESNANNNLLFKPSRKIYKNQKLSVLTKKTIILAFIIKKIKIWLWMIYLITTN
jgi:hypothetical protein